MLFQDDVVLILLGQQVAHSQSGLAPANNDRISLLDLVRHIFLSFL
jgi:hypothetical protein